MRSIAISIITALALTGPIAAQSGAPPGLAGQCFDLHARRYGEARTHTIVFDTTIARSGTLAWRLRIVPDGRSRPEAQREARMARGLWQPLPGDSLMITVF